MNKRLTAVRWGAGALLLTSALAVGIFGVSAASMNDDRGYHRQEDDDSDDERERRQRDVPANGEYSEQCGACHLAYPPTLLPAESWRQIMAGLGDHFGDNAELSTQTAKAISDYLIENAADAAASSRSSKLLRGFDGATPLRITELAYFRDKHDEVPPRMVKDNPKVLTLSNCNACHQSAERGRFDDDSVDIPGFGRWHD